MECGICGNKLIVRTTYESYIIHCPKYCLPYPTIVKKTPYYRNILKKNGLL